MSQKCALNICNKLKQYDADDKKKKLYNRIQKLHFNICHINTYLSLLKNDQRNQYGDLNFE